MIKKNQGDRFLNETIKWISLQKPVPLILFRTSDLRSKVLLLENTQINLVFYSLIRTSDLRSKVLTLDNKNKKRLFCFVLFSLIRTFAGVMKIGLVLEGGAMRGLFTCGIMDVMMENSLCPDGIIGVSAGAAFGCNYKSHQPGRAIRYNKRFARDPRYSGLRSLLTSGDYFNAEFAYHIVPTQYDLFDDASFESSPMEFFVVCTDVETGLPVYQRLDRSDAEAYDWIRASASMPLASKVVRLAGRKLLDGGVSDSIPLQQFERMGYRHNIVILTQPLGYQKQHNPLMPLMRIGLRKYPRMIEAMDNRHLMYNAQLEYVAEAEHAGRCLVIRPDEKLPIGHVCHDPDLMQRIYDLGREMGERCLSDIRQFMAQP